jgi:hypothetical protein
MSRPRPSLDGSRSSTRMRLCFARRTCEQHGHERRRADSSLRAELGLGPLPFPCVLLLRAVLGLFLPSPSPPWTLEVISRPDYSICGWRWFDSFDLWAPCLRFPSIYWFRGFMVQFMMSVGREWKGVSKFPPYCLNVYIWVGIRFLKF